MSEVLAFLSTVEDLREQEKIIYPLSSLLFMSICAIFCGAESWDDMVAFAESRTDWLSKYINMSPGIPCYSTFRRVFSVIDPSSWSSLIEGTLGIVIKEKKHRPKKEKIQRRKKPISRCCRGLYRYASLDRKHKHRSARARQTENCAGNKEYFS